MAFCDVSRSSVVRSESRLALYTCLSSRIYVPAPKLFVSATSAAAEPAEPAATSGRHWRRRPKSWWTASASDFLLPYLFQLLCFLAHQSTVWTYIFHSCKWVCYFLLNCFETHNAFFLKICRICWSMSKYNTVSSADADRRDRENANPTLPKRKFWTAYNQSNSFSTTDAAH